VSPLIQYDEILNTVSFSIIGKYSSIRGWTCMGCGKQ